MTAQARATWNGAVLADTTDVVVIDGHRYFPRRDVREQFLRPSRRRSWCPWKGAASYHHLVVDGRVNRNAAWYYPNAKPAAAAVRDRVAFRRGVRVEHLER
ncbi:MAG TPA: DUF427 domain-containing protein [Mycobacteriales bacterium]|nr:DUF427 domain-containing protein [Mycobacteriales bacterium]